jgi:hypothetical protein
MSALRAAHVLTPLRFDIENLIGMAGGAPREARYSVY